MNKYVLVEWPDSQEYMEEEWFEDECYLAVDHHIGSSYFIPLDRYENNEGENSVLTTSEHGDYKGY